MIRYIQNTMRLKLILAILLLILSFSFANAQQPDKIPSWAKHYFKDDAISKMDVESPSQKTDRLLKKFNKAFNNKDPQDEVQLIIKVDSDFKPEGFLSDTSKNNQRKNIKNAQDKILKKLAKKHSYYKNLKVSKLETVPYMSLRIKKDDIQDFIDIEEIADIQIDELSSVTMAESNVIIQATNAWANGDTGSGQTVAVLDTGVEKTHAFLSGKVISEACYSNAGGAGGYISLCPGGVTSSTASGSGVNCSAGVTGCDHGTHVAGTIAGDNGSIYGVAKDAKIIAINVFTNINGKALSYTSDQTRGLERVYALRNTYDIASINMSLGGGKYTSACDSDSRKSIIDNLKSAGIATVIATGNDGYSNGISAPGCISTAIAVGSTQDGSSGTTIDAVSSFSNSSSLVDLLAPGQYITSSVPGGGYSAWQGTSMATPHVAGAFAVVKGANNTATVAEIESALKTTGKSVTDSKNGVVKPRINLYDAIVSFGVGTVTVTISPAGAIADGAQWAIDGGAWNNSGVTVEDVSVGSHTISFKSITNSDTSKLWLTPTKSTISITTDGDNASSSITYTEHNITNTTFDADGDGKSDLVWRNTADGGVSIWTMDGNIIQTFALIQTADGTIYKPGYNSWKVEAFADMDGDGKSDLVWRDTDGGKVSVWTMDGAIITSFGLAQTADGTVYKPGYNSWVLELR